MLVIRINALGINLPYARKVNAARHKLTTAVKKVVSAAEETVSAATITEDEITLAQALAELKSVKPKVTTATTTTTKGILFKSQMKNKDQISFDKLRATNYKQVSFDEKVIAVSIEREKDEAICSLELKRWNVYSRKELRCWDYQMANEGKEAEGWHEDKKQLITSRVLDKVMSDED
ncbi:hypothetical protein Tco_0702482 [Tanacetum coccineum]|uniref:Uncharacterized protein n=1 Tax=Tanacetum coccineum TaxID=301880 RepID=A0ABQ4XWR0_9ASTR